MTAVLIDQLDRLAEERGITLQPDAALAPLTTLRVGGPAERLATPRSRDDLLALLALARDARAPFTVLGNGSDVVVADAGIPGLVIRNRARGIEVDGERVTVESGTPMAGLVKRCVTEGLAGLDFGISIPGSLGGAIWANAGAHGREMAAVVESVEAWDPADGTVHSLDAPDCAFGYRESRFKHSGEIVVSASLRLGRGEQAAIAALVAGHQAQRLATQPLADQNAGSVFRNPPGDYAGRLIEAAGLKGFRLGSAQVSTRHANFIVTDPNGRAGDVRLLGDRVRQSVAERFGVTLKYEMEFIGAWDATPPGSDA
jgi:UDP-N-acetylmuramate dehydrogenase